MASTAGLVFDAGTLLLRGPDRADLARLEIEHDWLWDRRVGAWRADGNRYRATLDAFQDAGIPLGDEAPRWPKVCWPKIDLPNLRPEQLDAKAAWMEAKAGYVVMPTGTGKTEVALSIMGDLGVATLIVAPVRDLMYQWHRRILASLGYESGVIGDSLFRVCPVSVTTYDSACIHMNRLGNQFELIVFDECHHLPGPVRQDAARMSAAPYRLGLTATPQRHDGQMIDFGGLLGRCVYELSVGDVKGRTLADFEIVRIPVHLNDEEQARYDSMSRVVRQYMHERRQEDPRFRWEDLCASSSSDPAARRALRAYLGKKSLEDRAEEKMRVLEDLFRLHAGEQVIVFAGSNAMARDVSRRFLIPCLLSHCGKKERLEILQGFARGDYRALVANRVLDEGVDLPEVKLAVVIGGLSSERQAKQRLGRVLRRSGDSRALLYEVVCSETSENQRSRTRRRNDAYQAATQRRKAGPR